jgi:hypothetical protein
VEGCVALIERKPEPRVIGFLCESHPQIRPPAHADAGSSDTLYHIFVEVVCLLIVTLSVLSFSISLFSILVAQYASFKLLQQAVDKQRNNTIFHFQKLTVPEHASSIHHF